MSDGLTSFMNELQDQREEWRRVLASGMFDRSPSLAQVFSYICEKYFEGKAGEIKEYTVAIDALGRSPEFDQEKDSIVRVQVHRLRKCLSEYYREEGASNPFCIVIPAGQYVPHFIKRAVLEAESARLPEAPLKLAPAAESLVAVRV